MPDRADDLHYLQHATRLALRGHGGAEPNPLVGCVVAGLDGEVIGWGYHRECGGPHAEIIALQRAGARARGATLYCTLEPCNHTGRTGPCTQAIISAGIARIVIARRDPNPVAAGGVERLRAAGIHVDIDSRCAQALAVSEPFVHRVRTGLPWVTAKWAQTLDGKIATRTGESQWITSEASRRLVHRERGRMDAILTGIGTVLRDDPMLTARNVRMRRIARRVIIDPNLETPSTARLVSTTTIAPTTIICSESAGQPLQRERFEKQGVEIMGIPMKNGCLSLADALRELTARYEMTHVMVEAGPGLLTRLFQQKLVNEAWVFLGPLLLGDQHAKAPLAGLTPAHLTDSLALELRSIRRRRSDIILQYRVK